jgi:hypothetical protein
MPDQALPASESPAKVQTTNDGWSSWAASAVTSAASAAASRVMSSPTNTPRESTNSQGSSSPKAVEVESLKQKPPSNAFPPPKSKLIPPSSSKFQIPVPATNVIKPAATDGWGWDDPEIPSSPVETNPTPKHSLPRQTSSGWENEEWDKDEPQSPHDAKKGWDEDW